MGMKDANDLESRRISLPRCPQESPGFNFVDTRGLGDIDRGDHRNDDTFGTSDEQAATLMRQRPNARGNHGVSVIARESQHSATLVIAE